MGFFDIFSTDDQQKAAADERAGLTAGFNQLSDLFNQGRGAINTNYADALAPFTNNYNVANAGQNQLAALLGLNTGGTSGGGAGASGGTPGGAGTPDIQKILASLPGYQFTLDQGDQNVLRNQAATGQLNSGATNVDLMKFGEGTAQQNYGNYVSQLMPFLGGANSAAGGVAGVKTGQGNALNTNLTTQGNAAYGTQAGIGNANAQADLAGLTQSGNIFGALTGGLAGALKVSDERAKDDIEPVGELFDGQPVFRYRYKGSPRHEIGLIAQMVEDREPGAVVDFGPIKAVNYRRATDMAAELGKYLQAA